jgi:hypothetical protein
MAPPTAGTSSPLKRQRVPSLVGACLDQKKKKLSAADLKAFPLLLERVNMAKGQFRVLSLIRQPYPVGPQRLSLADETHAWVMAQETVAVDYRDAPSRAELLKLVRQLSKSQILLIFARMLDNRGVQHIPIKLYYSCQNNCEGGVP